MRPSSFGRGQHAGAYELELAFVGDQRDHDLEPRRSAGALLDVARGARDRPHLDLVDLGMHHAEPYAARSEHRVSLLKRAHALELTLQFLQASAAVDTRSHDLLVQLEAVRQELVQRRIEQANRDRPARHRLEQPLEVALLQREQLIERGPTADLVLGHDIGDRTDDRRALPHVDRQPGESCARQAVAGIPR